MARLGRELQSESAPPRLFLFETEYLRTVAAAELQWVSSVVDDLHAGRLSWTDEWLAELVTHFLPPD